MAFWAFLPLLLVDGQENHRGMELLGIAVIILVIAVITATISVLRKDGLGHNPPVRSEEYWMARDLPSVNYTLRNF